ncbi:MAG: M56 family metallopeptidase [Blastocatellia bacterium]|nr:M56 family metallopeptidase [Blastocatellia bacterium]
MSVENFILINALLSVIAVAVAAAFRAGARLLSWHPRAHARLYASTLLIPPVASAWLVCASLLPAMWLGQGRWQQEHEPAHTLHLLNAFTIPLDPTLGYATLVFTTLAALIAAYAAMSAYFRIGRVIKQLEIGAAPAEAEQIRIVAETCRKQGIAVGLVASDYPFSFVWGYWDSKMIVSTGLLNALSPEELTSVLEHETAHHARRDNLAKLGLTICRYLSPAFPLTSRLYRWWSEQVELICDEIAAQRTQSPLELAGALVRLKRLTLAPSPLALRPAASALFGDDKENFEHRVERALSLAERADLKAAENLSRSCLRITMTMSATFALSLITLFAYSPLTVHKIVETILHVF